MSNSFGVGYWLLKLYLQNSRLVFPFKSWSKRSDFLLTTLSTSTLFWLWFKSSPPPIPPDLHPYSIHDELWQVVTDFRIAKGKYKGNHTRCPLCLQNPFSASYYKQIFYLKTFKFLGCTRAATDFAFVVYKGSRFNDYCGIQMCQHTKLHTHALATANYHTRDNYTPTRAYSWKL